MTTARRIDRSVQTAHRPSRHTWMSAPRAAPRVAFGKFGRYYPDGAEIRLTLFDVGALIERELDALERGAAAGHSFEFLRTGNESLLETDPQHVRYVVVNLLQNAVKYSPPGTVVRVELDLRGSDVVIGVRDEGMGIPPQEIENLFSPFYRASNVGDRPGTGMGLAIVKKSASLVGARVSVTSEPHAGTTFTVSLPRRLPLGPGVIATIGAGTMRASTPIAPTRILLPRAT